ncbi:MAG: undecaprenyl-diphosphate phosphatase [Actinomycetota bacterium]|nr:undecaprenyl-diphosphate phosphatase [Actinomycetota bacterium]
MIGLLQGVTELFPVSSLGHSVLVPALIGGSWEHLVTQTSTSESGTSPYLAFIVALHVATAIALIVVFRSDWARIIKAIIASIRDRRIETSAQRLGWLIVVATIPVGLTGLILEHTFRTLFAKPLAAAIFLTVNGFILVGGERLRRRADRTVARGAVDGGGRAHPGRAGVQTGTGQAVTGGSRELDTLAYREAGIIGFFQTFALLAGISRSGITMVAGLLRGLDHQDAARFSFLLATPVILAAGVLKLPSLAGNAGNHIHGQVIVGALCAGIAAYLSTRFLLRFFQTRTLYPFAIYSVTMGSVCIVAFA